MNEPPLSGSALTRFRTRARAFMQPVDEASGLADEVHRGAVALAWTALIALPAFVALDIARGATASVSCSALVVASLGYVAIICLARRADEHRPNPSLLLLGLGAIVVGFTLTAGWGLPADEFVRDAAYLSAVPLAFAVLAPWRPVWSATLGLLTFAATTAAVVGGGVGTFGLLVHLVYSLLFNAIAMGATQRTRRRYVAMDAAKKGLAVADQMAQVGRMTAGIAHELKTPTAAAASSLTRASSLVSELAESIGHPDVNDEDLNEIAAELREVVDLGEASVGRTARFIQTIREHTQSLERAESVKFCASERLAFVDRLLRHRVKNTKVALTFDAAPDIELVGDPGKFEQIVTNLVQNAIDAITESGVGDRVSVQVNQRGDRVFVAVQDNGPGVPDELERRIFEPMFTTRRDGEGTGLGLAISRDLATSAFRGQLTLVRPSGGGARFVANLSASGAPARSTRAFKPTFVRTSKLRAVA